MKIKTIIFSILALIAIALLAIAVPAKSPPDKNFHVVKISPQYSALEIDFPAIGPDVGLNVSAFAPKGYAANVKKKALVQPGSLRKANTKTLAAPPEVIKRE